VKASDYVAEFLAAQGVRAVFEMTGGMITHLLDSLRRREDIAIISMHHEQGAAFAAEAGARMTGIPGVALATSGPGATNLLTGIGSCFFDSVPAVFITGQVNTFEQRGDSGVRQSGFQETDIVAVAEPITKAAWRVAHSDELPDLLAQAFRLALSGRKGPVLLDIAMDAQRGDVTAPSPTRVPADAPLEASPEVIRAVLAAVGASERPLIIAGGGVRGSGADAELRALAHSWGVPVATSLLGIDVIPADDELRVGMIGTYGNRWANEAAGRADLLLVIGSRLDNRQTGANVEQFSEGKTIIRVDIDPCEITWRVIPQIAVAADASAFLRQVLGETPPARDWADWRDEVARFGDASSDVAELSDVPGINVAEFMHVLSASASGASAFVADVGQNQMWAAQSLRLVPGQRFLTSAGMGAMGFSLPAAIGAAVSTPGRPVISVAGDGGTQVNIQEFETAARLGLPLKLVVLDNGCLGMVRQFQDEYFDSCYQSTVWGYGAPDFVAVAEAYGLPARAIDDPADMAVGVAWLMADPTTPALLHVKLAQGTRVRPKVAFGNPVYVMEPPPPTEFHDE
jgi:acetolactate synthase-1/2/3 large subunit